MRATISFEADVSKVNDIMRSLILEETHALEEAIKCMEGATSDRLVEGISEALNHIGEVSRQLEQYRGMVASFERSRFETILPSPASQTEIPPVEPVLELAHVLQQTQGTVTEMEQFNSFLNKIRHQAEGAAIPEEQDNDSKPEEG
jgi:hypothetical protein|tara:strand:- start:682 stop:1119 length:438 start_codon:yes stop_codon:yes gene_type:complete